MASLYPFIADGARSGQRVELKLHKALWKSVGHGDILSLSSFEVDLAGYLSVIVYSGNLRIRLQLNDRDETTSMGPCALQINSHTDPDAVYRVEKTSWRSTLILTAAGRGYGCPAIAAAN